MRAAPQTWAFWRAPSVSRLEQPFYSTRIHHSDQIVSRRLEVVVLKEAHRIILPKEINTFGKIAWPQNIGMSSPRNTLSNSASAASNRFGGHTSVAFFGRVSCMADRVSEESSIGAAQAPAL